MKSEHDKTIYACIHGHFYQPPRENPWLEEIEREESAMPNHDWNERIADECYQPNAAARILDGTGRIADLINNYKHMSFNFGPTLLRWLERHRPLAYRAVIEADRDSVQRTRGHGNAIAQVYNHVILPLANRRDKVTQVVWGIKDFEHRFGRKPDGMWLAETACDKESLEVLAEHDIKFTILSPYQAKRWRMLDGSNWQQLDGNGNIPTGRAYLYQQHKGRPIHLFFYDAAIAKGIAFERMLADASHLTGSIEHAFATRNKAEPGEPWLVHTATDGESYGHHFKFGDMALAAAFAKMLNDPKFKVTAYAQFLASSPVRAEADILEVSAWSCAHGVGRWSRDCGCHIGGGHGWTQRWREPLREALDALREQLAQHYEKEMAALAKDPWGVRDAYIEVILDHGRAAHFVREQARRPLKADETVKFFRLLEMQRCALLMYTSCGWFFDDVSGGESIILMKYAARALELAHKTGEQNAEPRFLELLAKAESNIPGPHGEKITGRELFQTRAKPVAVSADNVAVSYGLRTLAEGAQRSTSLYAYRVTHHEEVPLTKGAVPCLFGRVTVEDTRTFESVDTVYALAHFGGLDFRCSTTPYTSSHDLNARLERVRQAALDGTTASMVRALDEAFGAAFFTLKDAFLDLRQSAARTFGAEKVGVLEAVGMELLESHRPLLLSLKSLGVPLPAHVETLAAHVLSKKAEALVSELVDAANATESSEERDFAWRALSTRLKALLEEASSLGLRLETHVGSRLLGEALLQALDDLIKGADGERVRSALRLVEACQLLGIAPKLWEVQTSFFGWVERARTDAALRDAVQKRRDLLEALDRLCGSRFAERALAS